MMVLEQETQALKALRKEADELSDLAKTVYATVTADDYQRATTTKSGVRPKSSPTLDLVLKPVGT